MALAVSLLFDDRTDRAVRQVWQMLAQANVCRFMLDLDYAPHLSLLVTDDETVVDVLSDAVAELAGEQALEIGLGPGRCFPETSIGWLACEPLEDLMRLHARIAACVPKETIREHYRPGQWTPHVTLQMTGDIQEGLAAVATHWPERVRATAMRVELARFMPVQPLRAVNLTY
jgi:hypothetical protein